MLLVGDPALRLLARLKLRGMLRAQRRRLRTPKGLVLTVLGFLLLGLWVTSILGPSMMDRRPPSHPTELHAMARFASLLFTLLSLSSALAHRGLYLPPEEIQRLFAAPVSRADMVRYRLVASLGRSAFGAVFVGVVVARRMPAPGLAFAGTAIGIMTLPLLNQLAAILAGSLQKSVVDRLGWVRTVTVLGVVVVGSVAVVAMTLGPQEDVSDAFGGFFSSFGAGLGDFLHHPLVRGITLPFEPWARVITAGDARAFAPWFGACIGIWVVLYELTARLPVDYRELSLATSASVAARLRRVRRGGGAAAGKASTRLATVRIPWLFGRGAGRAIAWRKTGAILRKAKGALWISILILFFVSVFASHVIRRDEVPWFVASGMISVLGTVYLCAGLRFDFRDELDRMPLIRSWPASPLRIFAAMLLPEVGLVSALLVGAVLVESVARGAFQLALVGIVALQPLLVLAWVALDNAVFLFAPVRFVPGQEGALQNAGRGMIMMLVRVVFLFLVAALGGLPAWGAQVVAQELLGAGETASWVAFFVVLWSALALVDLALLWLGGVVLRRFDVSRDRG